MNKEKEKLISVLPLYIFEMVFVLGPILLTVFLSFMTKTNSWDVKYIFTLENYKDIFNPIFLPSLIQSFKLAFTTTLICIVLGYPAGLFIASLEGKQRTFFVVAYFLPFFINSMVRLCGLIIMFRSNGLIDLVLIGLGITDKPLRLLYSYFAVVVGMVYVLLPMMIYPVYSSAAKLKKDKLEASRIMGANGLRAFLDVTLPLTAGGLLTGTTLCFIPSMGLYIISSLLGGGKTVLISNVIEDQLMKVHNLPFASALSVMLMALTAGFVGLTRLCDPVSRKRRKARGEAK